jgi:hypothetical protein
LSSSTVNVLWGLFNLAVEYLLVCRVGSFDLRKTRASNAEQICVGYLVDSRIKAWVIFNHASDPGS